MREIIRLCRQYNIRLSKKLSQHFLHASHIIDQEVSSANICGHDVVLDIGAGFGFLTERLAERAKKVYAVEIDKKLIRVLRNRLSKFITDGKVVLIEGDILEIDLPSDVNKIVSNPPFHIISPILFRLAERYFGDPRFEVCVLIVQLDYAKKMAAKPGEKRSRLSATIQYFANVELVSKISRRNFFPVPDVDAALIRLIPHRRKHVVDFETFKRVATFLFSTPNRVLEKVLKKNLKKHASRVIRDLHDAEIDTRKRIRELTNEEIELIAKVMRRLSIL